MLHKDVLGICTCIIDSHIPLDGLAVQNTGDETFLAPPPPGTPSLNEATSNTTFIDVTWDPPNFMFSNVFYRVELNLTSALGESRPSVEENVSLFVKCCTCTCYDSAHNPRLTADGEMFNN